MPDKHIYFLLFLKQLHVLKYIDIENYKAIYKYMYIQLQSHRNGHTPLFMAFIILHNFKRSDLFSQAEFQHLNKEHTDLTSL